MKNDNTSEYKVHIILNNTEMVFNKINYKNLKMHKY